MSSQAFRLLALAAAITLPACGESPLFPGGASGSGGTDPAGSGGAGAASGGTAGSTGGVPGGATGGTAGPVGSTGGTVGTGGTADTGGAGGGGPSDARNDSEAGYPTVTLPPGVQPRPYVDVSKTPANCTNTNGTPFRPSTDAEVASLLLGRWQLCSGTLPSSMGSPSAGLEFDRDRRWRNLVWSPNKTLVPASGFDSEGVWYMASEDPNDMLFSNLGVLRMTFASRGGGWGFPVDFLREPTRLRISSSAIYAWLGE